MNTQTVIELINSNPRYAMKAIGNTYHGKVFAVATSERIDTFYKTKRGAEGYINKQQRVSYYDEYTQEMVTCGNGLEVFEVQATDIIDPITNIQPWYNHIKSLFSKDWYVRDILQSAKYYEVSTEVMEYVEKAVNEALTSHSFTHIEAYDKELFQTLEETTQENEVVTIESNDSITVTLEENEKGIELYFSSIPSDNLRTELKANKFKWNPKKKCWYTYKTNTSSVLFAEALLSALNNPITDNEEDHGQQLEVVSTIDNEAIQSAITEPVNSHQENTPSQPTKKIIPLWSEVETTPEPTPRQMPSNVLDFTTRIQTKKEESEKQAFQNHFINDFIKTLSFEDQTKLADIAYQDNDNFNKVITELYLSYQVQKALEQM